MDLTFAPKLFELTVNNYKQPTTLPLRAQGALKEE